MRLFSPRLLVLHALGVVATAAAVWLGIWQYDAWQAARAVAAQDLASSPPVPLDSVIAPDSAFRASDVGRPVELAGSWVPEGTVVVSGRERAGRVGRWVVTPVAVCDPGSPGCSSAPAVLVVRGWLPRENDVPAAPRGPVQVRGWLQPGEGRGLPDPDPTDDVLPELRIASAIQHVDRDLYGAFVIASSLGGDSVGDDPAGGTGATSGVEDLEPVAPASTPEPGIFTSLRNLLYAAQWWVFGGFAVFLWWRWVKDELEREDGGAPDHGDQTGDREQGAAGARIASRS